MKMGTIMKKFKVAQFVMLVTCASLLLASGCARYARTVNTLYEPSAAVRGGSGEVYIVIPENSRTRSPDINWAIGKVMDDDSRVIDELFSPRSPAEIIQGAFEQEFRKAGYTVVPVTVRPAAGQRVIDLTKTEIRLEQTSDIMDLKVTCRVLAAIDVFGEGQLVKRIQYESTASRTDIRDRDMLAKTVLEDALQSLMRQAVPELHGLFSR
jgi:hypothetical protein